MKLNIQYNSDEHCFRHKRRGLTMGTLMSKRETIRYSLKPKIEAKSPAA